MFSLIDKTLGWTLTPNFWNQAQINYEEQKTEMQFASRPEDAFNFSQWIGVHASTLHVEDFIYMLQLNLISSWFDSRDDWFA